MNTRYLILDCFVDEPACFGVPPFISPYPRYVYGALLDAGVSPGNIEYTTIESLREEGLRIGRPFELVFLIGGAVVPGKYLGHKIGTAAEVRRIISENARHRFAIGGLMSRVNRDAAGPRVFPVQDDIEAYAFGYARGMPSDRRRTYDELRRWAAPGAMMAPLHPLFPHVLCEIESSRGCPRQHHCSFCSEGAMPGLEFRAAEDILAEIDALIAAGVSRFRIGRQADILQYGTECREFRNGFPRPEAARVGELFSALKARRDRGDITVLNIDNANPGTIRNFPVESERMLEAITGALTPGDTLALGVESLDPVVIARNNLKVDAEGLMEAVRIINRAGGRRVEGIPVLLPGINLIHGLSGETMDTFRINYEGLLAIRDEGLLVKRINIRKLLPFPGTRMHDEFREPSRKVRNRFEYYRDRIRDDIDHYMLGRIYPAGTVLRDVFVEESRFEYALAKQIASYSITVKVPLALPRHSFHDVVVTGHRERSLTALPVPVAINIIPQKALELMPGVSRRLAGEIIMKRPFDSVEDVKRIAPSIPAEIIAVMRV